MKIAEFLPPRPDRLWELSRQLGVRHVFCKCAPELTGANPPWDIHILQGIQKDLADAGLTLCGLEGDKFDMSRIKLGRPDRDEDIERYLQMIRNMGELGVGYLCYNFMAGTGWHRTRVSVPIRGGALATAFAIDDLPASTGASDGLTAETLWDNLAYFLRDVIPAAEAAGVRMAMHPDDPPLPSLLGHPRILSTPESFERALSLALGPSNGVTFCQANFRLMECDVAAWAERFARQGKLFFIHFRDVVGTASDFRETFHDDGPSDMPALIRWYASLGFDGPIRCDHVPTLAGETNAHPGYETLRRLLAIGYLKCILETAGIAFE